MPPQVFYTLKSWIPSKPLWSCDRLGMSLFICPCTVRSIIYIFWVPQSFLALLIRDWMKLNVCGTCLQCPLKRYYKITMKASQGLNKFRIFWSNSKVEPIIVLVIAWGGTLECDRLGSQKSRKDGLLIHTFLSTNIQSHSIREFAMCPDNCE